MTTKSTKLNELPHELICEILLFFNCSKSQLLSLGLINHHFYNIINHSDMLYHNLCLRDQIYQNNSLTQNGSIRKIYTYYRNIYYEYEKEIGIAEIGWFVKFNFENLKWEINDKMVINDNDDDDGFGYQVMNTLMGISNVFNGKKKKKKDSLAMLEMWMKPFVYKSKNSNDITNVLFVNGSDVLNEMINEDKRKVLMSLIMLFSSTVIIIRNDQKKKNWIEVFDKLVVVQNEPNIVGHGDQDMRSLLIINYTNKNNEDKIQAFDVIDHLKDQTSRKIVKVTFDDFMNNTGGKDDGKKYAIKSRKIENYPMISCIINWFGKIHGLNISYKDTSMNKMRKLREDLWSFLYDLTKPLSFGWELDTNITSNGPTISLFMTHCVEKANTIDNFELKPYKDLIFGFAGRILRKEMQNSLNFYVKCVQAEIEVGNPLEMEELVKISEHHATTSLKIFTEQIKNLILPYQSIREVEMILKGGINQNFREFWRINGEHSELQCEEIFDSCFKWIVAESQTKGNFDEFKNEFENRFKQNIEIFLKNVNGTRKYSVTSFLSTKYINIVKDLYPSLTDICDKLIEYVEKHTIMKTLEIDKKRSYLQKLGGLTLKLLTIENSIIRLKEELNSRIVNNQLSEEWNIKVIDRLNRLGIEYDDINRLISFRYILIESCKNAIQIEIEQREKLIKQISQFNQTFKNSKESRIPL